MSRGRAAGRLRGPGAAAETARAAAAGALESAGLRAAGYLIEGCSQLSVYGVTKRLGRWTAATG